ncbi:alpha/beta hydrolase [Demequina sp. SYSU T00192]|uniref:Alpha/beta hydrolase n=1 Tax=Demequina litoralis TaxID=3051660 RepID=A0ABT8G9V1_9MICO|nr:alpha/beta hydrolase [Demequina sp. SYSU T00192]MDN4475777.1 alpha/beta hydrolase [Demequina sp. SYSU T00192]
MSSVVEQGRWRAIDVGGAKLDLWETGVRSDKPPVILIGTALTADELLPVARLLAADLGRPVLAYRRRGYGTAGTVAGSGSVRLDAGDLVALMDELDIPRAVIVGVSYSGAVALQAAADHPERCARVVAIEPPPVQSASASAFRVANTRLVTEYEHLGAVRAADRFLSRLMDPHWRLDVERMLPGAVAQAEADAETFFTADIPALLAWDYTEADAAKVTAPVLLVSGTASAHWFEEEIEAIRAWFPDVAHVSLPNADHSMALTHPTEVEAAVAGFIRDAAE